RSFAWFSSNALHILETEENLNVRNPWCNPVDWLRSVLRYRAHQAVSGERRPAWDSRLDLQPLHVYLGLDECDSARNQEHNDDLDAAVDSWNYHQRGVRG